jgi:3-oxosteroid 1-dehydrogenase
MSGPQRPAVTADVVVLGSGAAGLTAALAAATTGAEVVLLERSALVGGTTCLSSGVAWLPANPLAAAAGVDDSREDALAYLDALSHGLIVPELAEAFVDNVAPLVDWLEAWTPLRLTLVAGFPDYHPEHAGGKPDGGRSTEPDLFSMERLGPWAERLEGSPRRMMVGDTAIGGGTGVLDAETTSQRERQQLEGLGRALVGALLEGCLAHGVEPRLEHRARRLLVRDGRVVGVLAETPEGSVEVEARRGVVIATGGFEWDRDLTREFLRGPMSRPATVPTNTGDGLRMAMAVGAELGTMREAWWVPVCEVPGARLHGEQAVYLVQKERTVPHSLIVNRTGRRFTNEAANYNALGSAFHQIDIGTFGYENDPCWLVFDQQLVEEYGGFGVGPGGPLPSWITRAEDLTELARLIEVPARELVATVERFNAQCAEGHDPDFRRGESRFDGYVGDRSRYPGPASTMGPLDKGPFHAVQLHNSTLGTKGGPRTDGDGAVRHVLGGLVPGLYAAGNAMARPPAWCTAARAAPWVPRWSSAAWPDWPPHGAEPRAAPSAQLPLTTSETAVKNQLWWRPSKRSLRASIHGARPAASASARSWRWWAMAAWACSSWSSAIV